MIDAGDLARLAHAKLFANISLEGIAYLLEQCYRRDAVRGEHIIEAGQPNQHLYLILSGELRVYLSDKTLPEHAVFTTGDCVGEMSIVDGKETSALVIAAENCELLAMPHEVLWSMVDCSHGVARNLLSILAGRMRNDNLAIVSSQSKSLAFEQAASVDALTGVHNRRWLMDAFPRPIARCSGNGEPLCLLMVDIDHFKRFNDRFGHLTGDNVLRLVARQLAEGLRVQDMIARYGGEEFLLLLPNADISEGLMVAERLRAMVAAACGVDTDTGRQGVTVSLGVAQLASGEDFHELIERADAALRQAKENGRNCVEWAR